MHKARAFFFVCAGIFLLSLAYHLGARSAGAQAGTVTAFGCDWPPFPGPEYTAVIGRTLYCLRNSAVVPGIPGTSPVVACTSNTGSYAVLLENGDCYAYGGGQWGLAGNVFGSATPAQSISIGQLKAKYAK